MGGGGGGGDVEARVVVAIIIAAAVVMSGVRTAEGSTWCIAKSGASPTSLQTALDYACGARADCQPIQQSGLCYLPNTVQAHSSYAFNSFYQRSNAGPGSCDFAGTATVTITDPSYGSCTYPSSASTAGGLTTPSTTPNPNITPGTNTPGTNTTPNFGGGIGGLTPGVSGLTPPGIGSTTPGLGGFTPGMGPATPDISVSSPTLLPPFFVSSLFSFLQLLF